MKHIPVLLEEVVENVKNIALQGGYFMDGTFGRGGHTRAILEARTDFQVLAFDCDQEAIEYGLSHFQEFVEKGRLSLFRADSTHFVQVLRPVLGDASSAALAGILLDLGVSSPQLDEGRRGFSFYQEGPLDMRMDHSLPLTAADIVNQWNEEGLNELFKTYGEVRSPYRVTQKILEARKRKPFTTTGELSQLIERVDGWRKKGHHPATNYFLALRLEVNQELAKLEKTLPDMARALRPRGRLLVITFHSLEDRIVKVAMKNFVTSGWGQLVNKKVIQPSWQDKKKNPRARSAKLRVFERTEGVL